MASAYRTTRLPESLSLGLSVTIALTLVSWLSALISHFRGLPKPYSWPYYMLGETALNPHGDRFADLTSSMVHFRHFGQADFFSPAYGEFLYPSPMALFYRIFLPTLAHPVRAFFTFISVTILIAASMLVVRLQESGLSRDSAVTFIALTVLFSAVLAFEFQRCNLEIIVFVFIATFLYLFTSGRPILAGVMLGGAIALKLYPFIFLGLFLAKKEFRAIVAASVSAGLWMLIGLATETGSVAESARGTAQGLKTFSKEYAENIHAAIGWDHSAFSLVKIPVFLLGGSISHALQVYMPLAALIGLLCYGLRVWKLPVFNQVTALSIFCILLPPVSFEYTLMQMFPAFAMFCCMAVRERNTERPTKHLKVLGICFGLLFSAMSFIIVHGHVIEGQLKSLVLIFLLVYVLRFPLYDRWLDADAVHAS